MKTTTESNLFKRWFHLYTIDEKDAVTNPHPVIIKPETLFESQTHINKEYEMRKPETLSELQTRVNKEHDMNLNSPEGIVATSVKSELQYLRERIKLIDYTEFKEKCYLTRDFPPNLKEVYREKFLKDMARELDTLAYKVAKGYCGDEYRVVWNEECIWKKEVIKPQNPRYIKYHKT